MIQKNEFAKNASKLHKTVGNLLRTSSIFGGYDIHQEYPASQVNPRLSDRFHFDWAIPKLKVVIECHGKQHYIPTSFGGVDYAIAVDNFHETQRRDKIKKDGALYNGWIYVEVRYDQKITEESLYGLYLLAKTEAESYNEVVDKKPVKLPDNEAKKAEKERARQYRKEQYQRQKEWKKKHDL